MQTVFCPSCDGIMHKSGNHMYCTKCDIAIFVVSREYVSTAEALVGLLLSNTSVNNEEYLHEYAEGLIARHLPMLFQFMNQITNGYDKFLFQFVSNAKTHAINLEIKGERIINKTDPELRCSCGSEDFKLVSVGELSCQSCNGRYIINEERGIYIPEFICENCGHIHHEVIDSVFVECKLCNTAHRCLGKGKYEMMTQ